MNHFTTVTWLGIFTNICHADYKLTVKNLNLKDQYSKILESNYHNKWVKPLRHNLKQKPKIQKKKKEEEESIIMYNVTVVYAIKKMLLSVLGSIENTHG